MSDWEETVLSEVQIKQCQGAGHVYWGDKKIAEAQAKETWPIAQQQLLEWLGGWCEHEWPKFSGNCERWDCPQCMQEIRKALGMEEK